MDDPHPSRFPIFPLPNVVLFPTTQLPLHVFEPRYRLMAADALAADKLIGMVLIRPGETPMQPRAPIFEIGCAGQMHRIEQLPDGRVNFVLLGERRFRIVRECDEDKPYRLVEAEWLPDVSFEDLAADGRSALMDAGEHLRMKALELASLLAPRSVEPLRQRMSSLDPIEMCSFLAFIVDCSVIEKQGVLEIDDPLTRVETLIRIVEFRKAEVSHPGGATSVN